MPGRRGRRSPRDVVDLPVVERHAVLAGQDPETSLDLSGPGGRGSARPRAAVRSSTLARRLPPSPSGRSILASRSTQPSRKASIAGAAAGWRAPRVAARRSRLPSATLHPSTHTPPRCRPCAWRTLGAPPSGYLAARSDHYARCPRRARAVPAQPAGRSGRACQPSSST